VRRLIGTSFDSSGAEFICGLLILTFCDRGAIGLLPPFDLCCANINHLWCLRENAPRSGSRAPSASTILSWSTGTPAPDRVATRAGPIDWFLSRQPPVTNIHASPCLPCHMVIGNSCNGGRTDRWLIATKLSRGEALACGNSARETAIVSAKMVRQMIIGHARRSKRHRSSFGEQVFDQRRDAEDEYDQNEDADQTHSRHSPTRHHVIHYEVSSEDSPVEGGKDAMRREGRSMASFTIE